MNKVTEMASFVWTTFHDLYLDSGRITEGAKLSTAAGGTCDEPTLSSWPSKTPFRQAFNPPSCPEFPHLSCCSNLRGYFCSGAILDHANLLSI